MLAVAIDWPICTDLTQPMHFLLPSRNRKDKGSQPAGDLHGRASDSPAGPQHKNAFMRLQPSYRTNRTPRCCIGDWQCGRLNVSGLIGQPLKIERRDPTILGKSPIRILTENSVILAHRFFALPAPFTSTAGQGRIDDHAVTYLPIRQ